MIIERKLRKFSQSFCHAELDSASPKNKEIAGQARNGKS